MKSLGGAHPSLHLGEFEEAPALGLRRLTSSGAASGRAQGVSSQQWRCGVPPGPQCLAVNYCEQQMTEKG